MGTAHTLGLRVLIFANGPVNDGPMVTKALADVRGLPQTVVLAADGGARVAEYYRFPIDTIIGDLDSLSPEEVARFRARGTRLERHKPEKDETDLELALKWAAEHNGCWIRIIGSLGDRIDQTLANVYLLALPEIAGCDTRLVAGNQEAWLLRPGEHLVTGAPGDTLSLIPLGGAVEGVYTENLYYPLRDETLFFGPARGISNVMTGSTARVSLKNGLLLAVYTIGRA